MREDLIGAAMDIRLPAALRMRVEKQEYFWAHCISLLISPPLVWALWVYAVTLPGAADRASAWFFASLFTLSVCAAPMLFVAYKVRIGQISDMHMRLSRERYIPYSIAIAAGSVCAFIFWQAGAAPILLLVTLVSIVELSLMLLVTFFSHVSLHAMALSSIISATALLFGLAQAFAFLPLLLLVVLARLVLKRHSPAQIIVGTLIGTLTPLAVVALLSLFL